MLRRRIRRSTLVLAVAVTSVAGCAGTSHTYPARKPQIRLDVRGACPSALGAVKDVSNPGSGLTNGLVPTDRTAAAGHVCEYTASSRVGASSAPVLQRRIDLDHRSAGELSAALAAVSLKRPTGAYSCPAETVGQVTIIVISYQGGVADVDLWYAATGCQTIDNGHVEAYQAGNQSFYGGFQTVYGQVVPAG